MFHKFFESYLKIASYIPVVVLILMGSLAVVAGDYFAKTWSLSRSGIWFALAVVAYGGSVFFYVPTLLREGLVLTSMLWNIFTGIGFLLIGLLVFRESLTVMQWIGVGLGFASLVLLRV